uniref:Ras-GEF domain-containing protein n=1 Tax=Anisakis simplex TaxID=6269 RepID=A0A0M3JA90_ANISI
LLEAMAEKLNFEFEDVTSTPSSSNEGIIHDTNERQQRRKIRNVSFNHIFILFSTASKHCVHRVDLIIGLCAFYDRIPSKYQALQRWKVE